MGKTGAKNKSRFLGTDVRGTGRGRQVIKERKIE